MCMENVLYIIKTIAKCKRLLNGINNFLDNHCESFFFIIYLKLALS